MRGQVDVEGTEMFTRDHGGKRLCPGWCAFFSQDNMGAVQSDDRSNRLQLARSGGVAQSMIRNDPDRLFLFDHPLELRSARKKAILSHQYPHELSKDFVEPLRRLVASVTGILDDSSTKPLVENAAELEGRMKVG